MVTFLPQFYKKKGNKSPKRISLVIGVKLGTYQYRGKIYHMSTLTGIVVGGRLLSKRQNHKEDRANFCGLLRKVEI